MIKNIHKYNNFLIFKQVESVDFDNLLPTTYNNLFYTKSDFVKMLKQVLDFYYDEFNIKFLGFGAEGDAFKIDSKDGTKVLKITNNEKEACAVEKIRKYNITGLVDYYDVRRIVDTSDIYFVLYSILMENVEPLNNLEKTVWTFMRGYFFDLKYSEKNRNYLSINGKDLNYNEFIKNNNIDKLKTVYETYKKHREKRASLKEIAKTSFESVPALIVPIIIIG